ncbi:MAG TPA: hypothetical protein VJ881_10585, partial [Halanaerobiales bacterium]|nr:hypothetical protein [Halanaerobiales bacterium]
MKKLFILVIIFSILFALPGCQNSSINNNTEDETTLEYLTISGKVNNPSQKISTQNLEEKVTKVILCYGRNNYKVSEVKEGSFSIQANRDISGGIIFIGENKSFQGYLKLAEGLETLPIKSINDDVAKIELGEINFDNKIGTPENNPLNEKTNLSDAEKQLLAQNDDLFASIIKNPDLNENNKVDLLEDEEIW